MPYEITNLRQIERTFYNITSDYIDMIPDIPEDVFTFSGRILDTIRNQVPYELMPNFVITLADHIAFCIERQRRGIYIQMPLKYEIEQTYPSELKLGEYILKEIEKNFKVKLNPREATGIALSIANARMDSKSIALNSGPDEKQFDKVLEDITKIIETDLGMTINPNTFGYARFSSHLQHLYARLCKGVGLNTENIKVYGMIREQYTSINSCVEKINEYFQQTMNCTLGDEEKLYLILHINRICSKEKM